MSKTSGPCPPVERVLAVDDDPVLLRASRAVLERAGYVVTTAGSGEEALSRIESLGLPNLALVDVQMPGMSGIELARQVHEYCDLPIVMLTSVDNVSTIVDALEQFADDYITKPIEPARARRPGSKCSAKGGRCVVRHGSDHRPSIATSCSIRPRLAAGLSRRRIGQC